MFAAGAGPGSGAERKWTIDYGAAKKLIDSARRLGVRRYVMLSSIGTDDPPQGDEVFSVYLRAKAKADEDLRAAGLDHTIVRPGPLSDDGGRGTIAVGRHVDPREIPRDDVAAVLAAVLPERRSFRRTFEVMGGDTPVEAALAVVERIPPDATP